jgi:CheY-like chemotaxis protein
VLLDIGLPDVDGYEVAARFRGTPGPKPPFTIALSGYERGEGCRRAAGIDLYRDKAVKPEEFGRVLGRIQSPPVSQQEAADALMILQSLNVALHGASPGAPSL